MSFCEYENESYDNLWNENDTKIKNYSGKNEQKWELLQTKKRQEAKLSLG